MTPRRSHAKGINRFDQRKSKQRMFFDDGVPLAVYHLIVAIAIPEERGAKISLKITSICWQHCSGEVFRENNTLSGTCIAAVLRSLNVLILHPDQRLNNRYAIVTRMKCARHPEHRCSTKLRARRKTFSVSGDISTPATI